METYSLTRLAHDLLRLNQRAEFFSVSDFLCGLSQDQIRAILYDIVQIIQKKGELPTGEVDYFPICQETGLDVRVRFTGLGQQKEHLLVNNSAFAILNLAPKTIQLPQYKADVPVDGLSQRPKPLAPSEYLTLPAYGVYQEKAYSGIIDYVSATDKAALLFIAEKPADWFTWSFKRSDLTADSRICSDLSVARCHLALKVLDAIGSPKLCQLFEKIALSNYADFVRWEATKYLYKIDSKKGLAVVNNLAKQRDVPGLRQAAQSTLDSIKGRGLHG